MVATQTGLARAEASTCWPRRDDWGWRARTAGAHGSGPFGGAGARIPRRRGRRRTAAAGRRRGHRVGCRTHRRRTANARSSPPSAPRRDSRRAMLASIRVRSSDAVHVSGYGLLREPNRSAITGWLAALPPRRASCCSTPDRSATGSTPASATPCWRAPTGGAATRPKRVPRRARRTRVEAGRMLAAGGRGTGAGGAVVRLGERGLPGRDASAGRSRAGGPRIRGGRRRHERSRGCAHRRLPRIPRSRVHPRPTRHAAPTPQQRSPSEPQGPGHGADRDGTRWVPGGPSAKLG